VRAGRLTDYLLAAGGTVVGVDISAAMVEHCRRQHPDAEFVQGDLRDLSGLEGGSFDVVIAGSNLLDVLDDDDRRRALRDIEGLLAPDGLLIMSSHNEANAAQRRMPWHVLARNPVRLARNVALLPRRMRNRRARMPLERGGSDHAILNDEAHDFALLHYYISPPAALAQLEALGYAPLGAYDLDGRQLAPGETAPWSPEVHYVARRRPSTSA
jgi:SAM-dependent methyltransferase